MYLLFMPDASDMRGLSSGFIVYTLENNHAKVNLQGWRMINRPNVMGVENGNEKHLINARTGLAKGVLVAINECHFRHSFGNGNTENNWMRLCAKIILGRCSVMARL